jgi:hypothetical protein
VCDFWKGAVFIYETKIEDNYKDGIYLHQEEFPKDHRN